MNAFVRLPSSAVVLPLLIGGAAFLVLAAPGATNFALGFELIIALALLGTVTGPPPGRRVTVGVEKDLEGRPRGFALFYGNERTVLEPGRTWVQVDHFKWVTRGVIESPQSFAVHSDGSIDFNGDVFRPANPDAAAQLEEHVNKRHGAATAAKPRATATTHPVRSASDRVEFKVRLDHLGHLLVEARRGTERTETGLRGISHLAVDGWMKRPGDLHVDPLQRYVEIDGVRFESNPEGALGLEQRLNERYAPIAAHEGGVAIEVRENGAAATGFDIHFWTVRAGTRFEIKGHLSQDKLDILQDHDRCDLIQPGIILRIAPPYLYIRRRRHDGGEERVSGLPDVKYRGITAIELQRLLNHPLIRSGPGIAETRPAQDGGIPATEVASSEAESTSNEASATAAYRPVPPPRFPQTPRTAEFRQAQDPAAVPKAPPPRIQPPLAPAPMPTDPALMALFAETDPHLINESVFRQLTERIHVPLQDLLLSLPRIFEDRRFEILDFSQEEIESVLQLRSDHFYGFYLTHIGPARIDLVYACHGTHIEWGTDKCALQPNVGAETQEFPGAALRGLAQNRDNHFVFVVQPAYRQWIQPHERVCAEAFAHFLTIDEWTRRHDEFPLIWPVSS